MRLMIKNKMSVCLLILICVLTINKPVKSQTKENEQTLYSPDKNLEFKFYTQKAEDENAFYYEITYKGKEVIKPSQMDLQLDNHISQNAMALKNDAPGKWFSKLIVASIGTSKKDTTWKPVYGENAQIKDNYQALTVHTVKSDNSIYKMDIEVRAYNEGVAFRFYFPENEKGTYYRIISENTEFTLPANTKAWHAAWAQAPYELLPLKNWPDASERPLTLSLKNGLSVCLAEAQMTNYARTKYQLSKTKANTLTTVMEGPVDLISPFSTPWRLIMVAENMPTLANHQEILLNLNEPSKIKDESWIKPGKIMRVMQQSTKAALENIDFAQQHHLQYILFDWKWYGPAFDFNSDATTVSIPDFDLKKIISYGKERGIGVWLYVNQQALLMQSDSLFRVYHKWGVAGVKFGFVQVGSHRWTTWIEKAFQQAADNQIMVNVHDEWRPTGEQRTLPNIMTAEGIRGNEEMPSATHNTILPFTRMMAGAADYTICYYDPRIKTTHAHQLALAAVYYSPIQTLFWYDKPEQYHREPEIEFFEKIPTSWDESKILAGNPGEYVSTARKSGKEWFVGTITNNNARTVDIPLTFLDKNKKYLVTIYSDDDKVATKTKVKLSTQTVSSKTIISAKLLPSGGQAMWIRPKE
ncbi:MAG TPA: glycoside hydrolase family 97 catalytic domain-containing protein [Pelobium sp.]|nr:glycoside hydrolase family 97 catalytic domain-containing protein [Pelobium sp.]